MSTDSRVIRAARRGAVSAVVAAVAVPAFAFTAPATAQTAAVQPAAAQAVAAQPAAPNDNVGQIAKGLIDSRLHVTSEAGNALSPADQAEVKAALGRDGDADVRAVVVGNDITRAEVRQLLPAVADRVGTGETFVAITADGSRMGGISKKLDSGEIDRLVTRTNGESLKNRLIQFGDLAERKVDDKAKSSAVGGFVTLGVLIMVVAVAAGGFLVVRRRRLDREARQMADLKAGVEEDVTLLGEDIARLDLDVMDPGLDPATRADYERAMNSYDEAKKATDRAARPQDMQAVTTALEDGRYYMTATRARQSGEPVPERRPPCFFNPQHGPSVEDVEWAPPGGTARQVPACAADAKAVLHGTDPDVRMVPSGGTRRPYWDAGPAYAPYAGGYYYGYGGFDLLGGLMIGTMLGSMMSGGWGAGSVGGDADVGGGFDFGGGDFGGGFGGGGDFGGGF